MDRTIYFQKIYNIYTDGFFVAHKHTRRASSKTAGFGGWVFCIFEYLFGILTQLGQDYGKVSNLHGDARCLGAENISKNTAELSAMAEAIIKILSTVQHKCDIIRHSKDHRYEFYTDSQYVFQLLRGRLVP